VPKSVSLVTQDELTLFNADNLTEALRRLGNVRWNFGNPRTGSFSLRGVTAGAGNDKTDPSVGLTVDGVSYAYLPLAVGSNIFDADTLDVTRGPQGTQGGKATSIGQINVRVRQPDFKPEASASLTLGQLNAVKTQAVAGGPLSDGTLAWRLSLSRDQQDGAFTNAYPDLRGRQSYVNTDRTYARAQLLYTPNNDWRIRLLYDIQPKGAEYLNGLSFRKDTPDLYANGGVVNKTNTATAKLGRRWFTQQSAFSPNDYYNYPVYLDNNGAIITGTRGALVDASWTHGNQTLTSLSSWRNHYFSAANDDGTPFDVTKSGGFITTYWQISQEFKLSSFGNRLLDYEAGLYFLKSTSDSLTRTRFGSDAGAYNASVAQYNSLDAGAATGATTTTLNTSAGRSLLRDSENGLYRATQSYLDNRTSAAYANLQWHLSKPLSLTTGARISRETRKLEEAQLVYDNGFGAALNPVAVNNVALGGFNSAASGALVAGNSAAQLSLADQVANRYFGVAITPTAGQAYGSLTTAQLAQVAAAKAVRLAGIGTLYSDAVAQPYNGTLVTGQVSLTYAIKDGLTGYVTWQHGAKSGIAQFNGVDATGAARSQPADPEKSNAYEVGFRGNFLNRNLIVNGDLFFDDIRGFQQTVFFYDAYATALANDGVSRYISGVGNVGKVATKGVELDAAYNVTPRFSLRFTGTYTDARYKSSVLLALPSERANEGQFYDGNGRQLQNAPKVQFSFTPQYTAPVGSNRIFHTSVSYSYSGRENTDSSLSAYSWKPASGIADLSIGLGRTDETWDFNLVVKNLLDEKWGNATWSTYNVNTSPRWIGLTARARFR
jgi:outer membrane receptor protein involved in Fe transport